MTPPIDRRQLLSASAASAAALSLPRFAWGQASDTIKVGVIGCGGRGTGAAHNCIDSSDGIEVVAMGDLMEDRLNSSRSSLSQRESGYAVTDDHCFVGWDAYEKVIASDVDLVILATPPHFRPMHLRAAIDAGKHVFMEKPVAVDAPGVRTVIAAGEDARAKGLGIVAGTQRRHQFEYIETIKRIHDGEIGEIVGGQCWWNQGGLWMKPREDDWTDMEWQLRNWLYFTWLSGDHICEQHIHNIDVLNWAIGGPPKKAVGMGGRQSRTDPAYGHVFDHFAVEYEYEGGVLIQSHCRQVDNCANKVAERVVGTKGVSNPSGTIRGESNWRYDGDRPSPYVQEHTDLIASIRAGEPLNEAKRVAESTLSAIMGRMSAYSGQAVTFEQALASEETLAPPVYQFGDLATPSVAIPGITRIS